jgi:hypothetical protein
MKVRIYGVIAGMVGGLFSLSGCKQLENRVATLEKLTADHTAQLQGIFAKETYADGKPLSRAWLTLNTLPLPVGSYVLSAQIGGTAIKQFPTGLACRLNVKTADGTFYQVAGGQAGLQAQAWEVSPIGTLTLPAEGVAEIECRAEVNIGEAQTSFSRLVAVGLPHVESPALKKETAAGPPQQSK